MTFLGSVLSRAPRKLDYTFNAVHGGGRKTDHQEKGFGTTRDGIPRIAKRRSNKNGFLP